MAELDITTPLRQHGVLDAFAERFAAIDGPVSVEVLPLVEQSNLRVTDPEAVRAVESTLGIALPGPLSSARTASGATAVWLGPDEWLLLSPPDGTALDADGIRVAAGEGGAVVDQSGQRLSLRLRGDVAGLLAKGTSLDLRPRAFGPDAAVQTLLAQAIVIVIARSADVRDVELVVRTSFARYVADWLLDALHDPLAVPAPGDGD